MKIMKKLITLCSIALFSITIVNAQTIETGYHGFVEGAYSIEINGATLAMNWPEINTIHGYQATPNLFVGAGVGFHFMPNFKEGNIDGTPSWKRDSKMEIPIFVDFRWTILNKGVTPFVDLRLGHNVCNGSGLYASVGAGCRYALKGKQAIYTMISYTTHKLVYEHSHMVPGSGYSYNWAYRDFEEQLYALSIKVGFEF